MRKLTHTLTLSLTALIAISGTAVAPAESIQGHAAVLDMDAVQTKIEFTLGDVLHTVHGSFKLKSGRISFDPETGRAGGALVVDATSGASGSDGRDRRMHKNILESEKFPEITFAPDRFDGRLVAKGDSEIALHGIFSIHGAGHALVLKTTVHRSGDQLTAITHFVVPYVEWGMKNPSTLFLRVSDKVNIDLQAAGRVRVE
jgi:polyisoprenoid-binding protein YceI